jgi:hypothetical protein
MSWAQRLKRVFGIGIEAVAKFHGNRQTAQLPHCEK